MLACAGLWVRNSSPTPTQRSQTKDVIFVGDSVTNLWSQDPGFRSHANWIDKGIGGQTSYETALRYFPDAISLYPKAIHIVVGTNDVYPGWKQCSTPAYGLPIPRDTCSNILYMVQVAQHYGVKVVLGTIPPWGCSNNPYCGLSVDDKTASRYKRIAEFNNFLKVFAAEQGVTLVDYHSILEDSTGLHYASGLTLDGIHPSLQGFEQMTPAAEAALQ
jgi:lysophospholipase L1-like esterase